MKNSMDDGEVELSDHVLLQNPESSGSFQGATSVDSLLGEFLKNTRTCTHTHTCNPRGPDSTHTHTCYHTHTQVIGSEEDDNRSNRDHLKAKRPSGNREAVRKYREKKKAHAAYLEEEVQKLRALNQQLVRKLQGQAVLEAEVLRLKTLLAGLRGKIDDELGLFPFQKQCNTSTIFKEGDCGVQSTGEAIGLQCKTDLPWFHPQVGSSSQANCQPAIIDCQVNAEDEGHIMETVETLVSQAK